MTDDLSQYALPGGEPIQPLPKIGLHEHLDGGVRPATVIELGERLGLALPATEPDALADWFHQQCTGGDLVSYLKTFDLTIACMQTAEGLERVAMEYVEDLAADGVVYAEVRWAPEQHLTQGLTPDEAVEAVQRGIDAGIESAASRGHDIRIGQLIDALRQFDNSRQAAEIALRFRDRGVVGFDIAGPEAGYPVSRHREAFDLLAASFLPATVHAGEADGIESIRGAILEGRALRLGHGVRIVEDIVVEQDGGMVTATLGEVAQWVRDREIALEVAPSSNLQTGAWGRSIEEHPFDLLYQLGFRVTVNPDNRLMSRTSITRELAILAEAFDYDLDDLAVFQLNAAAASFLPLEDRDALAELIAEAYA
ncbi:MAG: adenosine deaminase [Micrococcales bacterium 73-13]|nr:MAG: adenosine deaminase [Micrococcales bacterium 73-13]